MVLLFLSRRSLLGAASRPSRHMPTKARQHEKNLVEGRGALASVDASRARRTVRQREAQVLGSELLDVGAANVSRLLNLGNLEDVNAAETSAVAGSHVLVHELNGLSTAESTELLVHVVGTRARVVAEPDGEVLHLVRLALLNLV